MAATLPKLVLLSLRSGSLSYDMQDEYRGPFLHELFSKADITVIDNAEEASSFFQGTEHPAVFAMDDALSLPENAHLLAEAAAFVRNGGKIVFGHDFPSRTRLDRLAHVFSAFGLPWEFAEYCRSTFDLNPAMQGIDQTDLPPSYSMKGNHLLFVEPTDALYLPTNDARIESMVFAPVPIYDQSVAAVAIATVGEGKVGYIADTNGEIETEDVVLALLGLA